MRFLRPRYAHFLFALGLSAFVTFGVAAQAQTSDQDARNHFEAGSSYFKTSEYEDALREFQRAYELSEPSKKPLLLLNIAAVYERLGNPEKTVETLRRYLKERPDAPDKATIELRIKNLDERIEKKKREEAKKQEQARAETNEKKKQAEQQQRQETKPATPSEAAPPDRTAAYVVLGVTGAAIVGAVATGLAAQSSYDSRESGCAQTPQGCSDSEVAPVKTMAWVSTGLTGLSLVGAGVGMYMFFTATPAKRDEQAQSVSWAPKLNGGVGNKSVGLNASWQF